MALVKVLIYYGAKAPIVKQLGMGIIGQVCGEVCIYAVEERFY